MLKARFNCPPAATPAPVKNISAQTLPIGHIVANLKTGDELGWSSGSFDSVSVHHQYDDTDVVFRYGERSEASD